MRHIDKVLPQGDLADPPNYRPLLTTRLKKVLGVFALDAMKSPHLWAGSPRFQGLLKRINRASPDRRERFFDDVEVAAWLSGGGVNFAKLRSETSLDALDRLVERMESGALPTGRTGEEDDRRVLQSDCGREPAFDIIDYGDHGRALPNVGAYVRAWLGPLAEDKQQAPAPQPARDSVAEHLRRHLAAVYAVWPLMGAMIDRHIKAILIVPPAALGSRPSVPGAVFAGYANVWQLDGEGLVHEAIHQILYCLAAERRFISESEKFDYVSEWTGNVRNRMLYLHIPVVYYAVAEYWYRTLRAGIGDTARHQARLNEICRGLDAFFERRVGQAWLTADGRALHRELKERYDASREHWIRQP